jgi:hypothetical protein
MDYGPVGMEMPTKWVCGNLIVAAKHMSPRRRLAQVLDKGVPTRVTDRKFSSAQTSPVPISRMIAFSWITPIRWRVCRAAQDAPSALRRSRLRQ